MEEAPPLPPGPAVESPPLVPLKPGNHPQLLARGTVTNVWLTTRGDHKYIAKRLLFNTDLAAGLQGFYTDKVINQIQRGVKEFSCELKSKAESWKRLHHKNVVRFISLGDDLAFEVEYCPNGDARQYLLKHCSDNKIRISMISDVLQGMTYLHSQKPPVVHGGLSAGKIFVSEDGTCKIGEFSLSHLSVNFSLAVPSISNAEISRWLSPELVAHDYSQCFPEIPITSDIWALGCTIWEVVSGQLPYPSCKSEFTARLAIKKDEKPGPMFLEPTSPFSIFWPFVMKCWERDASARPTAQQLWSVVQLLLREPSGRGYTTAATRSGALPMGESDAPIPKPPRSQFQSLFEDTMAEPLRVPCNASLVERLASALWAIDRSQVNLEEWKLLMRRCVDVTRMVGAQVTRNRCESGSHKNASVEHLQGTLKRVGDRANYWNGKDPSTPVQSREFSKDIRSLLSELDSLLSLLSTPSKERLMEGSRR